MNHSLPVRSCSSKNGVVEKALFRGGSFVEALGQLKAELTDEKAMLGSSPKFVDRLLADLKRASGRPARGRSGKR